MIKVHLLAAQLNLDSYDPALLQHKLDAAMLWVEHYVGVSLSTLAYLPAGTVVPDDMNDDDFKRLPADLTEAILQLAAYWFEQREAVLIGVSAQQVPFGVLELVRPYRAWSF